MIMIFPTDDVLESPGPLPIPILRELCVSRRAFRISRIPQTPSRGEPIPGPVPLKTERYPDSNETNEIFPEDEHAIPFTADSIEFLPLNEIDAEE
jgi:hypothetical protein